jgi:hypothetical protein
MRKRLSMGLAAIAMLAVMGVGSVAAAVTHGEVIPGNPKCDGGTKIDPVNAGTYALIGGGSIEIILGANKTFGFDTHGTATVSAILVKGGPNAYLWTLTDPDTEIASGLYSPNNRGGQRAGLSHICIFSEKKDSEGEK